jgi:Fe-S cluster assembly scaffold protein SufB
MKNAELANFLQIDEKIKKAYSEKGVEISSIKEAWERHDWVKGYFKKKPVHGYFIWVKEQTSFPVSSCVSISKKGFKQEMENLIVIEKGINAKAIAVCNALRPGLQCKHIARGNVILKEDSSLSVDHTHLWGKRDEINPEYKFLLRKGSRLEYNYKSIAPANKIRIKAEAECEENASANIRITAKGDNSEMDLKDVVILKGKNSSGNITLRLVADKKTKIRAESEIEARSSGRGHLDCQGILLSNDSSIELLPIVKASDKDSEITHEASIGRISQEKLNYLRSRGLTEEQAIKMVVNGFLST